MYDTPLLFYETILINEAQVPPISPLCEVYASEMVMWKDFIILPFLIIMQYYVLCSSSLHLYFHKYRNIVKYYCILK